MNFKNFKVEKQPPPSFDWLIYGDICDTDGNVLATFGTDGTSLNEWWARQDAEFQQDLVGQFAVLMAQQIVSGDAE